MQSAFLPLAVAALAGAEPSINGGGSKRRTVISTQGLCGVDGGRAGSLSLSLSPFAAVPLPFPFLNHHKRNCAAAITADHWPIQFSVNPPIDIFCLCYCEVACNGLKLLSFLNFLEWRRRKREERALANTEWRVLFLCSLPLKLQGHWEDSGRD